jgi:hypothetical protein
MFKNEPALFDPIITKPAQTAGYHSNNKYAGFPPLMADGRSITASYQPEAVLNAHLVKELGIKSNWDYRQYLTKNSKEIMQYNCKQAANDIGYTMRYSDLGKSSTTPYLYSSAMESSAPIGYQTSDLKELYLSREQLQSRMVAPELTQAELFRR